MKTYIANITDTNAEGNQISEVIAHDARSMEEFIMWLITEFEITDLTTALEISIGDGTEPRKRS